LRLTIDSYAWIEMIRGTRLGIAAGRLVNQADQCSTPSIVLAEVAHRCLRDGFPADRVRLELASISEATEVVAIDPSLAVAAAAATQQLRQLAKARRMEVPGLGDGLVLATARFAGSQLLTGDPHFQGLPETFWLA
jgi:predicted nucleic acid-binding protein